MGYYLIEVDFHHPTDRFLDFAKQCLKCYDCGLLFFDYFGFFLEKSAGFYLIWWWPSLVFKLELAEWCSGLYLRYRLVLTRCFLYFYLRGWIWIMDLNHYDVFTFVLIQHFLQPSYLGWDRNLRYVIQHLLVRSHYDWVFFDALVGMDLKVQIHYFRRLQLNF